MTYVLVLYIAFVTGNAGASSMEVREFRSMDDCQRVGEAAMKLSKTAHFECVPIKGGMVEPSQ